jgi:hypothetical protein
MEGKRVRAIYVGLICAGAMTTALEARAQSAAAASASSASSAASTNFQNMTMGMGFFPMPGMFGSPTPSATDAAALGMTGARSGMMGTGGISTTNSMFTNPMASPMLYGSMFPMTQQQAGIMMLAGQAQMMGIGSGQLSGVRPGGAGGRGRQAQPAVRNRGSSGIPGGLAARYFNRTTQRARIPQGFYNRQNRHYPQVGR